MYPTIKINTDLVQGERFLQLSLAVKTTVDGREFSYFFHPPAVLVRHA
jgi:hypothetical protein